MKLKYCLLALLCPVWHLCGQTILQGVVHQSKTNNALPDVTVRLAHSGTQAISSQTGTFRLELTRTQDTLVASAVGYTPYRLAVTPNTPFLDILLEEKAGELDNVVVIGYGTTTQRYNTGSVATVSGADIAKQPVQNSLAALQGRVPGLDITQSNGVAGSSFTVQLRGQSSLLQGSQPLFVIDGVPYAPNNNAVNNLSSAAASTGSSGLSPFSSLNPQDIESISVLKDADATAIYGSRGANGVILITTKKGKSGGTRFSVTGYTGVSGVSKQEKLLNTEQYIAMRREALANDGLLPDAGNAPDLTVWDTARYTNFPKLFTGGTAHTTDVQASLSGGNAATQFLLSGGYHRETTVFPGDLHDTRGSLNATLNHVSDNKKLTVGFSALYSSEVNTITASDPTGQTWLSPNLPALTDSSGELNWSEGGIPFDNPLAYLQQGYRATTDNLLANLNLAYRLLPDLVLRVSSGYHYYGVAEVNTNPITSQNPLYSLQGYSQFANNVFHSRIIEPQADYSHTWGKVKLSLLAGGTIQQTDNKSYALFAYGYTNDQLLGSLSGASSLTTLSSDDAKYRYAALFGRINATLRNTYVLNLSGRRDGSSRFGSGRQWAAFGAVGGAWLFANETWVKKGLPFLSSGKLRGSYGVTGNDQIGNYAYLNTWTPTPYPYNGVGGLYPTRLFNPNYGWETNQKAEAGLEIGFIADRLLLNVDYYRNRSSNQLVNMALPSQTGFSSLLENLPATVQNTGWEAVLTAKNFSNLPFGWTTTLTLTVPKNKLVSFPGLASSAYASQYTVGKPLGTVKGYQYEGVDAATGLFRFTDVNKDGVLNEADRQIIADLTPKYYGGLLNSLTLKGWSLDVFIQFLKSTGRNLLATIYSQGGTLPGGAVNEPVEVLRRWQTPGQATNYTLYTSQPGTPAYNAAYYLSSSGAVYSDASFARLKNVSLSYALPPRMIRKAHIELLRVFVQGQNLLTVTRYKGTDPETQNPFILPPLRTITGGIQITL